jgi:hypothetical protein
MTFRHSFDVRCVCSPKGARGMEKSMSKITKLLLTLPMVGALLALNSVAALADWIGPQGPPH